MMESEKYIDQESYIYIIQLIVQRAGETMFSETQISGPIKHTYINNRRKPGRY